MFGFIDFFIAVCYIFNYGFRLMKIICSLNFRYVKPQKVFKRQSPKHIIKKVMKYR